ncbi:MAG TPA: MFS transporter, partial [Phototrophicaceae bacterium]|nr:MFS transporter [Phototrophicaceae bacterium]
MTNRFNFTGLWQHADFMNLWVGETISLLGSQITAIGLPLTAALILEATPEQMGILGAAEFLPFLLVGLFAGVWVDRRQRKPILMLSDLGRAILIATIPIAALMHSLRIEQLYVVGFLTGVLTVFFDVAYQSYLPSLVGRADLVEGNSKLEVSRSVTQIAGPGVAGTLIHVFTAPLAMVLDSLSYLVSAAFLSRIQTTEPPPVSSENRHMLIEIREGLAVVLQNQTLRSIAACTSTSNLFGSITQAVFILYVTRELKLDAVALGFIFGVASIGGLLGAVANASIVKRIGPGRTIIGGMIFS